MNSSDHGSLRGEGHENSSSEVRPTKSLFSRPSLNLEIDWEEDQITFIVRGEDISKKNHRNPRNIDDSEIRSDQVSTPQPESNVSPSSSSSALDSIINDAVPSRNNCRSGNSRRRGSGREALCPRLNHSDETTKFETDAPPSERNDIPLGNPVTDRRNSRASADGSETSQSDVSSITLQHSGGKDAVSPRNYGCGRRRGSGRVAASPRLNHSGETSNVETERNEVPLGDPVMLQRNWKASTGESETSQPGASSFSNESLITSQHSRGTEGRRNSRASADGSETSQPDVSSITLQHSGGKDAVSPRNYGCGRRRGSGRVAASPRLNHSDETSNVETERNEVPLGDPVMLQRDSKASTGESETSQPGASSFSNVPLITTPHSRGKDAVPPRNYGSSRRRGSGRVAPSPRMNHSNEATHVETDALTGEQNEIPFGDRVVAQPHSYVSTSGSEASEPIASSCSRVITSPLSRGSTSNRRRGSGRSAFSPPLNLSGNALNVETVLVGSEPSESFMAQSNQKRDSSASTIGTNISQPSSSSLSEVNPNSCLYNKEREKRWNPITGLRGSFANRGVSSRSRLSCRFTEPCSEHISPTLPPSNASTGSNKSACSSHEGIMKTVVSPQYSERRGLGRGVINPRMNSTGEEINVKTVSACIEPSEPFTNEFSDAPPPIPELNLSVESNDSSSASHEGIIKTGISPRRYSKRRGSGRGMISPRLNTSGEATTFETVPVSSEPSDSTTVEPNNQTLPLGTSAIAHSDSPVRTHGSSESLEQVGERHGFMSDSTNIISRIIKNVEVHQKVALDRASSPSSISSRASFHSALSVIPGAVVEDRITPVTGSVAASEDSTSALEKDPTSPRNVFTLGRLLDTMKSVSCLVHGNVDFEPRFNVNALNLNASIKETIVKNRILDLLRGQAFSMDIILQRRNIVMVMKRRSKRTFSYVVPLLSLLMDPFYYTQFKESNGPRCVIIAPNSHRVQYIGQLCLEYSKGKHCVLTTHGGGLEIEREGELANGCDILISTPRCWLRLLKVGLTDTFRLCHLVLDCGEDLFQLFLPEIKIMFNLLRKETELRMRELNLNIGIQTIIVNELWSRSLEEISLNHLPDPVFVFASHVEAAIYGRILPKIRLIQPERKMDNIIHILKECDKSKTVIACSTLQEMNEVFSCLVKIRRNIIIFHEEMKMDARRDKRSEWEEKTDAVLICTDAILLEMAITDAKILIHASLPQSKSSFGDRFIVIQESLPDRIKNPNASRTECQVIILMSQDDKMQFPAMVDFMLRIPLEVPDEIKHEAQIIKRNRQAENCESLCSYLLLRGDCIYEERCCQRHVVIAEKDNAGNLPMKGYVKCKILHVHSAIKFSVLILGCSESANPLNNSWTVKPSNMKQITSIMKSNFVGNRSRKVIHERPKIGDIVCVEVEFDVEYLRAKIIRIVERDKQKEGGDATVVQVVYLDVGYSENVKWYNLFALPSEIANLPNEAVDMCQINLLPVDMDTKWSYVSTRAVKNEVGPSMDENDQYILAKVSCSIGNTIMVESFEVFETIGNISTRLFNLKSFLLKGKMAIENAAHIEKIKSLCRESGIAFPENENTQKKKQADELVQKMKRLVQWSHLPSDPDELTEIHVTNVRSPSLFFCTNPKFLGLLKSLEKEMSSELNKAKTLLSDPCEGCVCAVQSPGESEWNRAEIINGSGDRLEVFFVDYGDCGFIDKTEAIVIPEKYISKLPFQVIECELGGIKPSDMARGQWSEAINDKFYDMVMEKIDDAVRSKMLQISVCQSESKAQMTGGKRYKVVLIDPSDSSLLNESLVLNNYALWDSHCNDSLRKWREKLDGENDKEGKTEDVAENRRQSTQEIPLQDVIENILGDFDLCVPRRDMSKPPDSQPATAKKDKVTPLGPPQHLPEESQDISDVPRLIHLSALFDDVPKILNVCWRQTEEYIWIKFMLTDIDDYGLRWSNERIRFWTEQTGQSYVMDLILFGPVYKSSLTKNKTGFYFEVKVLKVVQGVMWPRLTYLPSKCPFIKSEFVDTADEETLVDMLFEYGERYNELVNAGLAERKSDPKNLIEEGVPEEMMDWSSDSECSFESFEVVEAINEAQ